MDIGRCYELFLTDRKISGCSESTIRFYEYVVGKFLRFIEENNLDSSVESTHQHIRPFFLHLQQQDLSPSTYHTLFRGMYRKYKGGFRGIGQAVWVLIALFPAGGAAFK
jgi:site-specific recombinase XerD